MEKNVRFYALMSLAVIGIIAGPVGIANMIFGYILGDSPCTSCWALRISMVVVATAALFIIRYGLKFKYLALIMMVAAYGLWNAFWHLGLTAQNDIGQGQALMIFNIHTQMWAGIVFWSVILLLGLILIFTAPSFKDIADEVKDKGYRELSKINNLAFVVFFVVVLSNAFQAFVAVGPPPFTGIDNPARFTLNPKYNHWDSLLPNVFSDPSWRGPMGVSDPDLSIDPTDAIVFNNDSNESPLNINKSLNINSSKEITLAFNSPINGFRFDEKTNRFAIATEKWGLYLTNKSIDSIEKHFVLDHLYYPTVMNFAGVDFLENGDIEVMGYNKAYVIVNEDANADDVAGFPNFYEGADKFTMIDRNMFTTVRSKTSYVNSFARGTKYSYMMTVPSNLNKNFILIKQSNADGILSAELTPELGFGITLKNGRELGELYTTAMTLKNGKLFVASKNFNTIVEIDTQTDKIVETYSYPSEIKNLRAMDFVDGQLVVISYQDGKNILYTLK